ncbi:hypothetical protein HC026_00130 [Lactobacillus sp. LC28-10]|uniref:YdhG-like domain-containing protein n=1 Tax=Secundilactobacillus angelensis TaxID=2722706 RepID=A0ABX1KWW1_9LACO|nr:DUF1801 domain-containing protein [Secundilactobacillus angelensis]MCH5461830.1 DUF1801 domain-containing protein [Secundilactobacillus angelensis]NLR17318.1 hypothetical protein [Secundilactobacillus angelensis]
MSVIVDYIQKQPQEIQPQLMNLYDLLKQVLPDAEERISYGMPTFFQPKPVIYFGASKHHIGIYPTNEGISYFAAELTNYVTTKGSWHLSYDEPLPEQLIVRMAKHRLEVVQQS